MLVSRRQDKKGKTEWVIVGFGGEIFPFISSGRKIDTMGDMPVVGPGQIPHPLAVVLDALGAMLWQLGGICD